METLRSYPLFSLCGLNCGLCPRFHTQGTSRCPGCGGKDFHEKHPSCAVINCNRRHDQVEFCFQCSQYPCERYLHPSEYDLFIPASNAARDFEKAKHQGIEQYMKGLNRKVAILEYLLAACNDGRRKQFYCLAVNLLELPVLEEIRKQIDREISEQTTGLKESAQRAAALFKNAAANAGITLELRKKQT